MSDQLWLFLLLGAVQLWTVLMAIKLEYKQSSVVIFFWIANLAVYAIPFLFIDPWLQNIDFRIGTMPHAANVTVCDNPAVLNCAVFAISFNVLYLIARTMTKFNGIIETPGTWLIYLRNSDAVSRITPILMLGLVIGCGMAVLSIVLTAGLQGMLSASYGSFRLDANPYLKLVGYTLCSCSSSVIFILLARKQYLNLLFCTVCVLFIFLLGRTRQLLLPSMIPFAFYFLYKAKGLKGKLGLILLAVFSYLLFLLLQQMRYRGGMVDCVASLGTYQLYEDVWLALFDGKGELLPRGVYYWYMDYGHELEGFGQGLTYKRLLMLPIPSALCFGLKPADFTGIMYHDFYRDTGDVSPSIHPLLYGDAYTNLSWYGVLLGVLWAGLVSFSEHFAHRCSRIINIVLVPILGLASLMIARGAIYNSCATIFWSCAIVTTAHIFFYSKASALKDDNGNHLNRGAHTKFESSVNLLSSKVVEQ